VTSLEILSALLYGFIQGVTEFLPVSSSGHLALIPKFLDWKDPGVAFDLWMHVGTALAVFVYFFRLIIPLLKELGSLILKPLAPINENRAYLLNIIIATAVTGVLALSGKHLGETVGRLPVAIGMNLILFGLFMFGADFIAAQRERVYSHHGAGEIPEKLKKLRIKESLFIGLFQAMAIFPGVSRSGATLSIMRMMSISRSEAASFSFILSLPIIFIGALLKAGELEGSINLYELILGVSVSFIVGIITIHFFLQMIKKVGLGVFCIYRIILALFIFYFL
jgi:undecaprenyl-diphosphatase